MNKMEEKKIVSEEKKIVSEKEKAGTEKPKYNKTWQALLDHPINAVVYDKTLFYR